MLGHYCPFKEFGYLKKSGYGTVAVEFIFVWVGLFEDWCKLGLLEKGRDGACDER